MEYCPNCIEVLKKQSKKLGSRKVWFVCPACGYRTRAKHWLDNEKEINQFIKNKERINKNNRTI